MICAEGWTHRVCLGVCESVSLRFHHYRHSHEAACSQRSERSIVSLKSGYKSWHTSLHQSCLRLSSDRPAIFKYRTRNNKYPKPVFYKAESVLNRLLTSRPTLLSRIKRRRWQATQNTAPSVELVRTTHPNVPAKQRRQ